MWRWVGGDSPREREQAWVLLLLDSLLLLESSSVRGRRRRAASAGSFPPNHISADKIWVYWNCAVCVPVYHCVAEKTHICQKVQPSLISTPTNHYCRLKRRDQHKVVDTGRISPVIVVKGLYQELFNKLRNSRVLLCSKFDCHAVQCPLNAHFTDAFIIQSLLSIHTCWQITDFLLLNWHQSEEKIKEAVVCFFTWQIKHASLKIKGCSKCVCVC